MNSLPLRTASLWILIQVGLWLTAARAAGPFTPPERANAGISASVTNALVRSIGSNRFQIGAVTFDKVSKAIEFDAVVNMTSGTLEYLLVHSSGKVHESLLKTEAEPYHIHLAALLCGLAQPPDKASTNLAGVKIKMRSPKDASWINPTAEGYTWIYHNPSRTNLSSGAWSYSGSRILEGVFAAQRDGSIISLISDPDALISNPRPDRDVDDSWTPHPSNCPPVRTPITLIIEPLRPTKQTP